MTRVVVVGAGIGGLTTAALLVQAGLDVTVLEAHVYAGGCAGTFYHQGYRFDAGATLPAGFYPGGPMDVVGRAAGVDAWSVRPAEPAMVVHLPDGMAVSRFGGESRWEERHRVFGAAADRFWHWQETTSDALWDLALQIPPWPAQTLEEVAGLAGVGLAWLGGDLRGRLSPGLLTDALKTVSTHLDGATERMRLFVDAQLLIASQTTSGYTNALYGASALDLPRRGVGLIEGGMGAIAAALVRAVRRQGGRVHFRQQVTKVRVKRGQPVAVETHRGAAFDANTVIFDLPPWNVAELLGDHAPHRLLRLPDRPRDAWGAFMLYLGIDGSIVREDMPLHHQVVLGEPFGNGNTVFLSLSPAWDATRAPAGKRALTVSTHTRLAPWWDLFEKDPQEYETHKKKTAERVFAAASVALPGLREAAGLILPATPITFQRFTRRLWGWVGGFPQTSLFRTWGPRLAPGLWLVGDSIFPGQSVPAVALGGIRVARALLKEKNFTGT